MEKHVELVLFLFEIFAVFTQKWKPWNPPKNNCLLSLLSLIKENNLTLPVFTEIG